MEHDDDSLLASAMAKIATAEAEMLRWQKWVDSYWELRGVRADQAPQSGQTPASIPARKPTKSDDNNQNRLTNTERAALKIIDERGRPVPSHEMLGELRTLGIEVGGKDAMATLAARLSRAPSIINIRGSGWTRRPSQEIGVADPARKVEPATSDTEPNSDPVKPAVGGGI